MATDLSAIDEALFHLALANLPADITDSLGIGEGTLRQWHRRGHIRKNGNRYDVGAACRRRMNA